MLGELVVGPEKGIEPEGGSVMMASVSAPPVALLIIDMQAGSFVGASPSPDLDGVVGRINAVADAVRETGGLVVFIQHDAPTGEIFAPGEPGWGIIPELSRSASDPVVHKEACDAFYQTELEALLHAAGIRQLLISGSATDFCVDTTVRAAASLDFEVTVVRDGHLTSDRDCLDAASIIEHAHYVWEELLLPGRRIEVLPAAAIIQRLCAAVAIAQDPIT